MSMTILHRSNLSAKGMVCRCPECDDNAWKMKRLWRQWEVYGLSSQPTWTEGKFKTLYHGTSRANARLIFEQGVSLPWQRGTPSVGQLSSIGGFYLTDNREAAIKFALFTTKEPYVAVLSFRWRLDGMKILEFGPGQGMQDFGTYFILSFTNWGRDVTSLLPREEFMDRQMVAGWRWQRPMKYKELKRYIDTMVNGYDMIAAPMLITGATEIHVCQYAIVSTKGLGNLSKPDGRTYDCNGIRVS
ncbi:hypothetical protein C8R46DRAFT_1191582 [Mycena filopes]|nr:hypothetical protein C8R46DRAFT_1191582 [Mycena filopes]